MTSMKVRASVVAVGVMLAVISVGVGSAIAVSHGDDQVANGESIASGGPVASEEPAENPERVYVGYKGETAGFVWSGDFDAVQVLPDGTDVRHAGQIGWSVWNEEAELVGYVTKLHGFIPLSEVETYKANPSAYLSLDDISRKLSDDELPPGFPTSRERTGSN